MMANITRKPNGTFLIRVSNGMKNEIAAAEQLGLPILYRSAIPGIAEARGDNNAV